jgi:hypothetical protein
MAVESFDEALDAETVLWAVRGMNATRLGVSADDVARFLSKDTTLSARYDRDDVDVLLDSLTADGMLTYEPTTGEFAAIEADGTLAEGDRVGDAADHGDDDTDDTFTRAFAGLGPRGEAQPTAFGEAVADAFSRLRIEQLEHERNVLSAERDELRRRAEAAEADADAARAEGNEFRARIRELERLLDEERAAGYERSDNTRRAALALARAQEELDGLRSAASDSGEDARPTRSRRPLRGNWLS